MGVPTRKPWICAENGCFSCQGKGICDVPDDCAFSILHALEMMEMGLQERPRRWGKTHAVAELAAKMMNAGCDVAVVAPTISMRDHGRRVLLKVLGLGCLVVKERLVVGGGSCRLETKESFTQNVAGIDRMMVLTDDLMPEEVEGLKKVNPKHDFVLGYYTQR